MTVYRLIAMVALLAHFNINAQEKVKVSPARIALGVNRASQYDSQCFESAAIH